jgi:hypothetical protein
VKNLAIRVLNPQVSGGNDRGLVRRHHTRLVM